MHTAIQQFIDLCLEQDDIQFKDADEMTANTQRLSEQVFSIHEQGLTDELLLLLQHKHPSVAINAASGLFYFHEQAAMACLTKIMRHQERPYNLLAKFTLEHWTKRNGKEQAKERYAKILPKQRADKRNKGLSFRQKLTSMIRSLRR